MAPKLAGLDGVDDFAVGCCAVTPNQFVEVYRESPFQLRFNQYFASHRKFGRAPAGDAVQLEIANQDLAGRHEVVTTLQRLDDSRPIRKHGGAIQSQVIDIHVAVELMSVVHLEDIHLAH